MPNLIVSAATSLSKAMNNSCSSRPIIDPVTRSQPNRIWPVAEKISEKEQEPPVTSLNL
jgi:hypothetical protein